MVDKLAPAARHSVVCESRTIYQWTQTITDVDIFVGLPAGVSSKQLDVQLQPKHLCFGIRGNPPYLDLDLYGRIIPTESTWTLEDGELHITLQKATQGEPWRGAMAEHCLDELAAQDDKKRLLLERFQLEHPGMDFSGAEMNGEIPDPAGFLGGFEKQK